MTSKSRKEKASDNIKKYHHEGYPHKQAIAIGLRKAGVPKNKSKK